MLCSPLFLLPCPALCGGALVRGFPASRPTFLGPEAGIRGWRSDGTCRPSAIGNTGGAVLTIQTPGRCSLMFPVSSRPPRFLAARAVRSLQTSQWLPEGRGAVRGVPRPVRSQPGSPGPGREQPAGEQPSGEQPARRGAARRGAEAAAEGEAGRAVTGPLTGRPRTAIRALQLPRSAHRLTPPCPPCGAQPQTATATLPAAWGLPPAPAQASL